MNVGIGVACVSVFCFSVCAGTFLQAQTSTVVAHPAEVSNQDSANDLSVAVGKSVLVDFAQPVQRVAVGLNDIAEATAISATEIMVNGKTPGQTSLIVWERGGDRQFFNVTVYSNKHEANDRLNAMRRELNTELPGQGVKVSSENGSIFLRGTVKDIESSERAVQIASTALPPSNADSTGKSILGSSSASNATGKVINLLYVEVPPAEKQILLKVRFASVDRNKAKQLGINLFSLGLGNTVGGISTGQFTPPIISGSSGSTSGGVSSQGYQATFTNELNFLAFFPGLNGGADIQALETKGVVEVLSEPNLLAANGKQASFLAGGEYPYPVASGSAGTVAISIMFKEYGVRLNFIPTITPRGTIRLQVAPEVSSLDFTNAITISGFVVPAIATRKVNTEVELGDGQSFILGGLLDNRETQTFERLPFIGQVPILGKFFQSIAKNRTNTELIVICTPELVNPILAGAPLPELNYPEKFLPPNSSTPMHTPDTKSASTSPPPPATIPVEKLIESRKPEKPLVIDEGYAAGSGSSAAGSSSPQ
jgi:pilus assembly protein CpaC